MTSALPSDLPEWIRQMATTPIAFVAPWIGMTLIGRAASSQCFGPCPACSAPRRHAGRRDKRGAIGVGKTKPAGWRCMECREGGTALDLVAWHVGGARYRDLDQHRKQQVRAWCERYLGVHAEAKADAAPAPKYPPAADIARFWEQRCAEQFAEDGAERGYVQTRGIAPERAIRFCRPITPGAHPRWARFGGRDWFEAGYRLAFPVYDAAGQARSLVVRNVLGGNPKSVPPAGFGRSGLVLADSLATQLLQSGAKPAWWPASVELRVLVAEGEIDFLTWATQWDDSDVTAPATFGIFSGSWTLEIASRIPDDSTVVIATHDDDPGEEYARLVARSLQDRDVRLERWRPPQELKHG